MKGYNKPVIENILGIMENVDLKSGTVDSNCEAHAWWVNHNTGSHSVLAIITKSSIGHSVTKVEGTISYKGAGQIRHSALTPNDGNSDNFAVQVWGNVIYFSGNVCLGGNNNENRNLGIGGFDFSFDNGTKWGAYIPEGSSGLSFGETISRCDNLFDVKVRFYN